MKHELGGKMIKEFAALRVQLFKRQQQWKKKLKSQKVLIKRKRKVKDYKNCLKAIQLESKINQLEKVKLAYIIWKKVIKKLQKQ